MASQTYLSINWDSPNGWPPIPVKCNKCVFTLHAIMFPCVMKNTLDPTGGDWEQQIINKNQIIIYCMQNSKHVQCILCNIHVKSFELYTSPSTIISTLPNWGCSKRNKSSNLNLRELPLTFRYGNLVCSCSITWANDVGSGLATPYTNQWF